MTYTEAKKYLKRAVSRGYIPVNNGIVSMEIPRRWGGNTTGHTYGINIDGDGRNNRYFGCPRIIWSANDAEEKFPAKVKI